MSWLTVSVEANGQRGENRRDVAVASAVECLLDMLKARLHGHSMAGQQCKLRGAACKAFQRGKAVQSRELTDRVHPGIKVERRQAGSCIADLGHAQPDLIPHPGERIGSHACVPPDLTEGRAKSLTARYG